MRCLRFVQLAGILLSSGLLGCETVNSSDKKLQKAALNSVTEPTVLIAAQHYTRLLTQTALPITDSLTHYNGLLAQPDVVPGRYLLRLPTYTIVVQPDAHDPKVILEPAARTQLYNPLPTNNIPSGQSQREVAQVDLTPRKTNPVLAVSLPDLVAAFGPWQGDDYAPVEEPLEPDMHGTTINYHNLATGQGCRISVRLRDKPQATANAVHDIQLARAAHTP